MGLQRCNTNGIAKMQYEWVCKDVVRTGFCKDIMWLNRKDEITNERDGRCVIRMGLQRCTRNTNEIAKMQCEYKWDRKDVLALRMILQWCNVNTNGIANRVGQFLIRGIPPVRKKLGRQVVQTPSSAVAHGSQGDWPATPIAAYRLLKKQVS